MLKCPKYQLMTYSLVKVFASAHLPLPKQNQYLSGRGHALSWQCPGMGQAGLLSLWGDMGFSHTWVFVSLTKTLARLT